ncbi:GPALPP motifs-containing protein 1 [Gastrophryne carolinensis]
MSQDIIGPALPPGFRGGGDQEGPEAVAGPVLPPGYKDNPSSDSCEESDQETGQRPPGGPSARQDRNKATNRDLGKIADDDDGDFFGPALPPGFKKQPDSPERPVLGPALPPGFRIQNSDEDASHYKVSADTKSESSDSDKDDSSGDEDNVIGPLPSKGPVHSTVAEDIERRAWKMKQKLSGNDDGPTIPTRESWMTELPPELTSFGLGPRTFKRRANEASGDRSEWTDTPADKERKAREKKEGKVSSSKAEVKPEVSERDRRLADQVSTYNDTKRSESLMDLHRKKLKRKAEENKDKPKERRAFDREQDLQVNRFDDAQKKALLRKSQELNTRFSHGGSSGMFL